MAVRAASMELSWLPLSERKGMGTPELRFEDFTWASGYYMPRGIRIEELEHTGERDVIVVSTCYDDHDSVLAHEFRHMQQRYIPSLPRIGWNVQLDFGDTTESWEKAIRVFYRRPWELDALKFEHRLAPSELNERCMRLI